MMLSNFTWSQLTSSRVSGTITTDKGTAVSGSVTFLYVPTNLAFTVQTDARGRYELEQLSVGGPYTITVNGLDSAPFQQQDIYLALGDNTQNIRVSGAAKQLDEVVVKKSKTTNANGTQINERQISGLPNINRGIQDVTKLIPQSANNSFAGTNFRYNNVTIDGSINNDAIGFSPSLGGQSGTSGMPGSSTRSNSISLDAIQDMQVYIAPYDVKLGNFLGGSINAVTRSGSNQVTGSAYTYGRNASLTGPNRSGDNSAMPSSFSDYQVGFRVGFPIVKDKLFFFTNAEYTHRTDPVFYNAGEVDGNGSPTGLITEAQAQQIKSFVQTKYGFDAGTYNGYDNFSQSRKFFNKLDWNINAKHQFSIRNNIVLSEASNLERDGANFRFSSMDFTQKNRAISTVLEFKSHFNSAWSNSFIAGLSQIHDFRDPTTANPMFPQVEISMNGGTVLLGNEREATVFNMRQNTWELTDNLTYKWKNHRFLVGTHNEFYHIEYGFVNALNGRISYSSLANFLNSTPSRVRGTYSFNNLSRDAITDNPYAQFDINLYSVYVQDDIKWGDRFKITPGIRIDYTQLPNKPNLSPKVGVSPTDVNLGNTYNYTPLNQINQSFFGQALISPRLGLEYWANSAKTVKLRGGSGVFTGRIPFAWLGYAYYNDGVGYGSYDRNNLTAAQVAANGDPLAGNNLANYQDRSNTKIQVDLIDNNFKMPQVWRNSLAVDYTYNGYKMTLEGIYTKVINDLKFQQVNRIDKPTYYSYDTQHQMPIYGSTALNSNFSNAYLLSNTSEGYRYSVTAQVSKTYPFGLNAFVAYTYGDSKDISNGIRNSMESNYQMNQSLTPNNPQLATSNFNIKHRVLANVGYEINTSKNHTLSATVFFNAQSGNPFTWGFVNSTLAGTGQAAGLAYVFRDAAEAALYIKDRVVGGVVTETAAQQVANYESFVNGNSYLSSRRGAFTERNGDTTPWNIQADMRIQSEYRIKVNQKSHTIQLSMNIINVTNLINKDWGKNYFVPNTFNSTANVGLTKIGSVAAGSPQAGDPTYNFQKPTTTPYTVDAFASRFQAQLGLRYSF
ncbi:MAG: TonB-dependent receptor [Flavobacterium sp. BFFFF2]|nr:MAG: TonB-dependent receptor [Flavobacterium sp. BFFFF2]